MSDILRTTPLHAAHLAAHARMVPFGGWDMPLHYGSQIDEHHRVRRDAGMFDVSHMSVLDVTGVDASAFLRRMLANDVAKLGAPGRALYSCMLNDDGGVLDDLIVYRLANDGYRLVVNAATADKDFAWLESGRARFGPGVRLAARRDLAIIAVQGPNAHDQTWRALPDLRPASEPLAPFQAAEADSFFIARTGYTGEDGFELMLPAECSPGVWRALETHGVGPAGLGARDTLRLEAGMNLYGQDMDEHVTPFESALAWTVDLRGSRDFIGKAALTARPVERQLVGLALAGRGIMRAHQAVRCAAGEGIVTSGGYSPTLERSIALARIPAAAQFGEAAEVRIRDAWLTARIVKPPFVRYGKILVGA